MLLNIQFLRFVAAMLVVLYHTAAQVPDSPSAAHGLFALGQAIGFAGVDIFFVISGFIMAFTTFDQGGRRASAGFARRRLTRIFSGHWPFFVLTLIIFQWTRPELCCRIRFAGVIPALAPAFAPHTARDQLDAFI